MQIRNADYQQDTAAIFAAAPFIGELGIEPVSIAPGLVEASLQVATRHLQQDRFIHAGVQATLADHTAGAAAFTVIGADQLVLTSGFSINLMSAASGERLLARAQVLKAGQRLVYVESSVFTVNGVVEKLVAKAMVTLAVLPRPGQAGPDAINRGDRRS